MLQGTEATTEDLVRLRSHARSLNLRSPQSSRFSGSSRSPVKGRGMEYEESREYTDGDDVRLIDWRVTARTGKVYTKVFREDRQRTVFPVVDLTPSMHYGTRTAFKSLVAVEAATTIAWAAYEQGDMVSMTTVTKAGVRHTRPLFGLAGMYKQLDLLVGAMQEQKSHARQFSQWGVENAVAELRRYVQSGDLVVILSDFFGLTPVAEKTMAAVGRKPQLLALWVTDQTERTVLPKGKYPVSDGTDFSMMHLSSKQRRNKLQNTLDKRCERVEQLLKSLGIPVIELHTGDEVQKLLSASFRKRSLLRPHRH